MEHRDSSSPLPERPPPEYFLHHNHNHTQDQDPNSLQLPSIPSTILKQPEERTLPPISSLTKESDSHFRALESTDHVRPPPLNRTEESEHSWPSSNPLATYYQHPASHASPLAKSMSVSADSPNPMDLDTDSRGHMRSILLSMDDPDVRMAAEALGDLRADFIAPPQQNNLLPTSHPSSFSPGGSQPEPILSLLTSNSLLGPAIGGSMNVYSASKNYSPAIKSVSECLERHLSPVVNTVGTVGRSVGVERPVRWLLSGQRRPSHHQPSDTQAEASNKRRKVSDPDDSDMENYVSRDPYHIYRQDFSEHRDRGLESLPAYDNHRSPTYEEQALVLTEKISDGPSSPRSWPSKFMLGTSGLSVAMSEESLRSLKYCLTWLRWANDHIAKVIDALRNILEQYESTRTRTIADSPENGDIAAMVVSVREEREHLNDRITALRKDVLKTLREVVDVLRRYAGSALPENARVLVRKHLTSLPYRFTLASMYLGTAPEKTEGGQEVAEKERVKENAHKVIVLAKEGLDIMAQVSGVVDGTIVSAEQWIDSFQKMKGNVGMGQGSGHVEEGLGPRDEKEKAEFWDEVRKSD